MIPPPRANSLLWDGHRDANGNPTGALMMCTRFSGGWTMVYWVDNLPIFPTSAYQAALSAVESLQLHRPVVGVGAFTYPGYYEWGLTWWVGSPMWLWIDSTDSLQWGTHTLNPTAGGFSLNITVTASEVRYDPGDGSRAVVCRNPGTPRYWNPKDPISRRSPSGCDHKYLRTNTLGEIDSRYTISATVIWDVNWTASDGDYGHFTVEMSSIDNPSVHIGEMRAVIIPNDAPAGRPT